MIKNKKYGTESFLWLRQTLQYFTGQYCQLIIPCTKVSFP
jgi:hypothetical protein